MLNYDKVTLCINIPKQKVDKGMVAEVCSPSRCTLQSSSLCCSSIDSRWNTDSCVRAGCAKCFKRFDSKKTMPYNWEVIELFKLSSSVEASDLEVLLHKNNRLNKYKPKKQFCGSTECYTEIKSETIFKI